MKAVVVDTNVAVIANGAADHVSPSCVITCVDRLRKVVERDRVVIDDEFRIINEYRRHMNLSGQPGVGDLFLKWLWTNQANPARCEQVHITPREEDPYDYEEFPDDEKLADFDRSDRKFVAVIRASTLHPVLLNGSDTDWQAFRQPLEKHGVKCEFLCPELME